MQWSDQVVLLTGASRGIGVAIARALAAEGARLALVARSAEGLEAVRDELRATGATAVAVPADLSAPEMAPTLRAAVEAALGPVDVLVNNAGLESVARYEQQDPAQIRQVMEVNLLAPMLLTRELLPGMITRRRGHVVTVASMAGLTATAYGEAYYASKHGVVGFTRGLRASLRADGHPVSASSVCPGYIRGAGMFADQVQAFGSKAPPLIGESTPEQVAAAVIKAVRRDLPEVIVNPGPMRTMLALGVLSPRLSEWLSPKIGGDDVNRHIVDSGGAV